MILSPSFYFKYFTVIALLIIAFAVNSANAQSDDDLPTILKADIVKGDKITNSLTAIGNVEVTKGNAVIYTDKIVYDKGQAVFRAIGNVRAKNIEMGNMKATSGNIKEDFSSGSFFNTTLILNDGSYLTSPEIQRKTPKVTDAKYSIFSICPNPKIAKDNELAGKNRDMLTIKSKNFIIDREQQVFIVKKGTVRFYGAPFLYIPSLEIPLPSKKRKSGFLFPSYTKSTRLGVGYRIPYYFNIAINKELTVTPTYHPGSEQLLIENDFRHLTSYGEYNTFLELANNKIPPSENVIDSTQSSKKYRWHLKSKGLFDFTKNTGLDFNIDKTSDASYLRDYHYDYRAYSQSKVNVDYIKGRTYYAAKAISFQEFENQDVDNKDDPLILPQIDTHIETKPLFYKEKYSLTSNTVILSRESGAQYRRSTVIPEVSLPINYNGNLFVLDAKLQGDLYSLENNFKYSEETNNFDSVQTNYKPEFSVLWRLPLVKKSKSSTLTIEPMASFVSSSYGKSVENVPNEDSNDNELTISNLFTADRVSGYDRSETGDRISYGATTSLYNQYGEYGLILGQSIKTRSTEQDVIIRGFNDNNKSNIVGMTSYKAVKYFNISYSFQLNESDYLNEVNEISSSLNFSRFTLLSSYILLRKNTQNIEKRSQLNTAGSFKITKKITTRASLTKNLVDGKNLNRKIGLYYNGCCTVFGIELSESKPSNLVKSETSINMSLSFKNL